MTQAPVLVTERLELWQPTKDDIAPMHAIVSVDETARFLGSTQSSVDHFQRFARNAGSWFLYGYGSFMVRLKETDELIGNCGVFHSWRGLGEDFDNRPEAGWILRHDLVGRGLAREAMRAAIGWFTRQHGTREICCMIAEGNARSFALAEWLCFVPIREAILPDGGSVQLFFRPAGAPLPNV